MSSPSQRIWPSVGNNSVASILMSVVLPAPLGATRPYTPGSNVSDTSSRAVNVPNRLVTCSTDSMEASFDGRDVAKRLTSPKKSSRAQNATSKNT